MHTSVSTARRILVLTLGIPSLLHGQDSGSSPFSIDARIGVSLPTGELARGQRGVAANAGVSKGVDALLRLHSGLSVYGGWSRHGLACSEDSDCAADAVISSSGFEGGVKIVLPHQTAAVPWFRGGVTLHRFRYDLDGVVAESDATPGFEVGTGADILVHRNLSLTPGLRFGYTRTTLNLETFNTGAETFQVSVLVIDIGGRLHF